jgi:hypothetical protein
VRTSWFSLLIGRLLQIQSVRLLDVHSRDYITEMLCIRTTIVYDNVNCVHFAVEVKVGVTLQRAVAAKVTS